MRNVNVKTILLVAGFIATAFLGGCTDWEKKYSALNVEHQNTMGLLDREKTEKGQLAEQVAQGQQTIEELQKQIKEGRSTAQASGFGEGYDVAFDAAAGTVTVTLPNAILFNAGKADLKESTNKELDHIASVLDSQYKDRRIAVVGHTDSDPIKKSKWADNWELSAQRSLSVVRYMIKKGVQETKIQAVGMGDSKPVVTNDSAANKAKNRRVEIVVYMK